MGERVPRWSRLAVWSMSTQSCAKKWRLLCSLLPRELSPCLTCIFADECISLLCSLHPADFTSWGHSVWVWYWRTTVLLAVVSTSYRSDLQRWHFVTDVSISADCAVFVLRILLPREFSHTDFHIPGFWYLFSVLSACGSIYLLILWLSSQSPRSRISLVVTHLWRWYHQA